MKAVPEAAETMNPEPATVLAPDLARAALAFLERSPIQGRREAQTYLHLCAVLEALANDPIR